MSKHSPFSIHNDEYLVSEQLVRVPMPVQANQYLSLLCLSKNISKSSYLRIVLKEHLRELEDEDILLNILANRAFVEWKKRLRTNRRKLGWGDCTRYKRFREYEQELRLVLKKRRISVPYIDKIIQRFENLYGIGQL